MLAGQVKKTSELLVLPAKKTNKKKHFEPCNKKDKFKRLNNYSQRKWFVGGKTQHDWCLEI